MFVDLRTILHNAQMSQITSSDRFKDSSQIGDKEYNSAKLRYEFWKGSVVLLEKCIKDLEDLHERTIEMIEIFGGKTD